ncbi:hypothetical protein GMAR_ORF52 [Golden Marseillevirus]|uniref:hypothetical protein n=1 Tax=Golden Marseillevirus TaxID=1720526 RepID=UPI000877A8DF|nr:hypothetical protein GMAR_ORF52 [Golden Marseillevirus]ALX27427.1 hypothetical protein GMAR_ORF52 [Golden Marseillevirus]
MYVFKYPNGFGEYATEKPMRWDSCNPTTLDFQVPTKLGQTLNASESAFRLGIPQTLGFILLSYDDRGDEQLVQSNIQELENLDQVPLFISLPLEKALLTQKPVFGVYPVPQTFKDNIFSVSLSEKEELWALLQKEQSQSFLDLSGAFGKDFVSYLESFGKTEGSQVVVSTQCRTCLWIVPFCKVCLFVLSLPRKCCSRSKQPRNSKRQTPLFEFNPLFPGPERLVDSRVFWDQSSTVLVLCEF